VTVERVRYQLKQSGRRFLVEFDLARGVASVQGAERDALPRSMPMAFQSAAEAERLCGLYLQAEAEPAAEFAALPLPLPNQMVLPGVD